MFSQGNVKGDKINISKSIILDYLPWYCILTYLTEYHI